LALVARVPAFNLDSVLTPLRVNNKILQMLRIEKAEERPDGKNGELVHDYRPFTDMTARAQHYMNSREARAANEASVSVELQAAHSQQAPTLLQEASQMPPPRPAKPGRAAEEEQWTRQEEGTKRLKRPPQEPMIALKRAQALEKEAAAASKKNLWRQNNGKSFFCWLW
jgi:hypothetical protein